MTIPALKFLEVNLHNQIFEATNNRNYDLAQTLLDTLKEVSAEIWLIESTNSSLAYAQQMSDEAQARLEDEDWIYYSKDVNLLPGDKIKLENGKIFEVTVGVDKVYIDGHFVPHCFHTTGSVHVNHIESFSKLNSFPSDYAELMSDLAQEANEDLAMEAGNYQYA